MTTAAAFEATFSDFKIVKGRKQAQIILEVPLEAADVALKVLGGVPRPDAECWVAVARLNRSTPSGAQAHEPGPNAPEAGTDSTGSQRPEGKQRFSEKPASVRAALLCKRFDFQAWVGQKRGEPGQTEQSCTNWLRSSCGVHSRATLDSDPAARARFELLENQYMADTNQMVAPR